MYGVSAVVYKGANAALARDRLVVPARHDVLRREQQLFKRGCNAALEQHRLAHLAQLTQQVKVLHVTRAHLEDINVGLHERDLGDLHDLADDQEFEFVSGFAQGLKPLLTHALERIWRRARLEGASAQHTGASGGYLLGHGEKLLARLDRTPARHHHDLIATDRAAIG